MLNCDADVVNQSALFIFFTRPTCPSVSRTFMPCGCVGLLVSMSFTTPSVSFPVRWSFFNTMETSTPAFMSALFVPSKPDIPSFQNTKATLT